MEIPKFNETFIPILEVLKNDKIYKSRDLIEEVKIKFYSELNDEQLKQKTKSGDLLIDNRIAWGKSYLKKGGYILFPERGLVQITEKGKKHSATLTVRDLENESSLFDFYKQEKEAFKQDELDELYGFPKKIEESSHIFLSLGRRDVKLEYQHKVLTQ
jgi:restriction system protein